MPDIFAIIQAAKAQGFATDEAQEILRNSFLHLIRNSLDHGIESADERTRQGKSAEGTVTIETRLMAQWVEFRLTDDGRGLDLRKIAAIGLDRKLIDQEQLQDDEAVARLVFLAGFSTAESVTDISGRGVGMMAVAQYVQDAGGSIHIELRDDQQPAPGFRPCAFVLRLPRELFQTEDSYGLKEAS